LNLTPKQTAVAELIFASVLWGFGFVATIWALEQFSPTGFMTLRFLVAWLAGELIRFAFYSRNQKFFDFNDFKLSIGAGLLMASFLLPQTIGLMFTTATNSGFLTILYVILVPVLSFIFFQTKHPSSVYFLAIVAFIGAFLMMGAQFQGFNSGDLWTLLCALTAALHILYIGRISDKIKNSFRFNNYQSLWCLLVILPLIPFDTQFSIWATDLKPWLGILATIFGSSLLGFMIQIRAQKVLSDTTASQLFLLESPFALLFGLTILNESLTPQKACGAILILLSSFLTLKLDRSPVVKTDKKMKHQR
jgi:drug/metabolite transporter (DMT)-like permease